MSKGGLRGQIKRLVSLEKPKGHLTYSDLSRSPLPDMVSSDQLDTWLGTIDEVEGEILDPSGETDHTKEVGGELGKSEEANSVSEDNSKMPNRTPLFLLVKWVR